MKQIEANIIDSFKLVKKDIQRVREELATISKNQENIMAWLQDTRQKEELLRDRLDKLSRATQEKVSEVQKKQLKDKMSLMEKISKKDQKKTEVKVVTKAAKAKKTHFVASKTGKKFHMENCPFGKNIKPKSKLTFKSKTKALNDGFKPCDCVKRV